MSPRILARTVGTFIIGVTLPVAFALSNPSWIDEEFRRCTAQAISHEMDQRIDAERDYYDDLIQHVEAYRDDLGRAWQIVDEDQRRDSVRDADRRYRDATREAKRDYDTRLREIKNESRDQQRECRTHMNDYKRFVRDICLSTADCRSNQVCTTERGVCDAACPPGVQSCAQVCAGTCERVTSSRSSSSRTSSSWSSTSSRSSTGGYPGVNCEPYHCPDGREAPSCDARGYPIEYVKNPCYP